MRRSQGGALPYLVPPGGGPLASHEGLNTDLHQRSLPSNERLEKSAIVAAFVAAEIILMYPRYGRSAMLKFPDLRAKALTVAGQLWPGLYADAGRPRGCGHQRVVRPRLDNANEGLLWGNWVALN